MMEASICTGEGGFSSFSDSCLHANSRIHTDLCARSATLAALAIVTFVLSLYHVVVAILHHPSRPYRLIFFLVAAAEMAILALFQLHFDQAYFLVALQFLKINQYCLLAVLFFAFMAQLHHMGHLKSRVIWPAHFLLVIVLISITIFTMVTLTSYKTAKTTPGWLGMSITGCVLGICFLAFSAVVAQRANSLPRLSPIMISTKRRLWGLLFVSSISSVAQFCHDIAVALWDDCDEQYLQYPVYMTAGSVVLCVLDTFLPIWAVAIFVARSTQQTLAINSERAEYEPIVGAHDHEQPN